MIVKMGEIKTNYRNRNSMYLISLYSRCFSFSTNMQIEVKDFILIVHDVSIKWQLMYEG